MDKDNIELKNWKHLRFEELFQNENSGVFFQIKECILSKQSEYQRIDIFDSFNVGRIFSLDGIVQTVEEFEFMYHEMLVHVAMFSHKSPENILIIGGGDGGTLRETLRHACVKKATMCEIDPEVVKAAREHLPTLSCAMNDERANILFTDGAAYVSNFENYFDVIIIDSTDPTAGEGGKLFTKEFYKRCYKALRPDGVLVAHSENPVYDTNWLEMAYSRIKSAFDITKMYTGFSPQYPSGFWTYTIGTKGADPVLKLREDKYLQEQLRYYNEQIHEACFALPTFLNDVINRY